MTELEFLQHDTAETVDTCVIWLHGLGASGDDFLPIIEHLRLPISVRCRFIFPQAPVIPITINQGFRMPGWYDIRNSDIIASEDGAGIEASSAAIDELIAQQLAQGMTAGRILLAGFSQGGVIALHCGLRRSAPALGGVMALSAYLPACASLDADHTLALFFGHGTRDHVVPIARGRESWQRLTAAGYTPEWQQYDMEHSVCMAEIIDIRRWLLSSLGLAV